MQTRSAGTVAISTLSVVPCLPMMPSSNLQCAVWYLCNPLECRVMQQFFVLHGPTIPEDAHVVALLQALDMMPSIKNAVGNLFPIFMDGGIRRGTDMLKVPASLAASLQHALHPDARPSHKIMSILQQWYETLPARRAAVSAVDGVLEHACCRNYLSTCTCSVSRLHSVNQGAHSAALLQLPTFGAA